MQRQTSHTDLTTLECPYILNCHINISAISRAERDISWLFPADNDAVDDQTISVYDSDVPLTYNRTI